MACHSSQNVLWWPALKMASAAVVSAGFLPAVSTHLQPPSEWKEEGGRDIPTPFWAAWVVTSAWVL